MLLIKSNLNAHSKKSSIASQLQIKCMAVRRLMNELNFLKYNKDKKLEHWR
jgi:hypothetical protein